MEKLVDSEVLVQHRVLRLDVSLAHLDHIIGVSEAAERSNFSK